MAASDSLCASIRTHFQSTLGFSCFLLIYVVGMIIAIKHMLPILTEG